MKETDVSGSPRDGKHTRPTVPKRFPGRDSLSFPSNQKGGFRYCHTVTAAKRRFVSV